MSYTNESKKVHVVNPNNYREFDTSCNPQSQLQAGSSCSVDIFIGANEVVQDIVVSCDVKNNSATDEFILHHAFLSLLNEVEIKIDNRPKCYELKNGQEILLTISNYYKRLSFQNRNVKNEFALNNGWSQLTSHVYAIGSTVHNEVSLMPLVSEILHKFRGYHGSKITIDFKFRGVATSAAEALQYIKCSTSNTNMSGQWQINNLKCRTVVTQYHPDLLTGSTSNVHHKFEVISRQVTGANVSGTKFAKVNLSNDFSTRKRIVAVHSWVVDNASTYNGNTGGIVTQLTNTGFVFSQNGKELINMSTYAAKMQQYKYQLNNRGYNAWDLSDSLLGVRFGHVNNGVYLSWCPYDSTDSSAIEGVSNDQRETYELELTSLDTTLPASCILYVALEYIEMSEHGNNKYSLRA